jgi:hypothetical protein
MLILSATVAILVFHRESIFKLRFCKKIAPRKITTYFFLSRPMIWKATAMAKTPENLPMCNNER